MYMGKGVQKQKAKPQWAMDVIPEKVSNFQPQLWEDSMASQTKDTWISYLE